MRKKSFTLLELTVVIVIIGILATLATPRFIKIMERAKATEAINMLGVLKGSQIRYKMEMGNYYKGGGGDGDCDGLDIDLPLDPEYFYNIHCPGVENNLAQMRRKGNVFPPEYGTYILYIGENGDVGCIDSDCYGNQDCLGCQAIGKK